MTIEEKSELRFEYRESLLRRFEVEIKAVYWNGEPTSRIEGAVPALFVVGSTRRIERLGRIFMEEVPDAKIEITRIAN